jgi:hypothetical protein
MNTSVRPSVPHGQQPNREDKAIPVLTYIKVFPITRHYMDDTITDAGSFALVESWDATSTSLLTFQGTRHRGTEDSELETNQVCSRLYDDIRRANRMGQARSHEDVQTSPQANTIVYSLIARFLYRVIRLSLSFKSKFKYRLKLIYDFT